MRLSSDTKEVVMGNIELLKYCNSICVDMNKLKKCNIEKMGSNFVFVLSKENKPVSKCTIPLDIDIATQPDVILIMSVENGKIGFETTDKTVRVLNK